jgi:hypothetical protein
MHGSRSKLLSFFSVLLFACCHHHADNTVEFLRTDGFRYRAGSAVVGAALDTLRIAVVVLNGSPDQRAVMVVSPCAPFNRVSASVNGRGRKWDSDTWRPVKQPATHDSSGRPIYYACTMQIMGLAPGTSRTFALAVPVKEVLGDSLPRGRYRITARVRINGALVRGLDGGDVELSSPAIER